MKIGRNDPCPCGSGKKYKQCCLRDHTATPSDPAELAYRRLCRELKDFNPKLIRFSVAFFDTDPEALWLEFCSERPAFAAWGEEVLGEVFMTWLCFHRVDPDSGQTAAQHYLEVHTRRLSSVLREYLQSGLNTPFSYLQVHSVDPGRTLDLVDLLAETHVQVRDVAASSSMPVGAIGFGKVVQVAGFALLDGFYGHIIPAMRKPEIIDLREALKTEGWQPADEDYNEELFDHLDHLATATLPGHQPKLRNQHGEDIELHVLRYQIESVPACIDALMDLGTNGTLVEVDPEYDSDSGDADDGYGEVRGARLHWMEDSADGWLLATIQIEPGSIRVEVNSRERAERVQAFFSRRMSHLAKPLLSEISSSQRLFDSTEAADQAAIDDLNQRPEVQALIEQQLAKHYESWPDIPVPALGNQTPIEAVKTPVGKEKVEALLDGFAGGPMPIPAGIMRKLRERLGLA